MFYKQYYQITSPYGPRTINGVSDFHKGIDMIGINDLTILSPIDGIVGSSTIITDTTNPTWEWGNYVRIDSSDGKKLFFCHLASRLVEKGATVRKGAPIGVEGNTGYSLGRHLHFEVRNTDNVSIDPVAYMLNPNKIQGKELTYIEAKQVIKTKASLEDSTIQYFEYYRYGEDLIFKLAKALI